MDALGKVQAVIQEAGGVLLALGSCRDLRAGGKGWRYFLQA